MFDKLHVFVCSFRSNLSCEDEVCYASWGRVGTREYWRYIHTNVICQLPSFWGFIICLFCTIHLADTLQGSAYIIIHLIKCSVYHVTSNHHGDECRETCVWRITKSLPAGDAPAMVITGSYTGLYRLTEVIKLECQYAWITFMECTDFI